MKRILWSCLLVLLLTGQALAEPLTIAAGAGYKKLVTELAKAFETASGTKTELVLGNMCDWRWKTKPCARNLALRLSVRRLSGKAGVCGNSFP